MKNKFKNAYNMIRGARKVLVVTHGKPDGDAIASTCILQEVLINLEKNYTAFCLDEIPFQFDYLVHSEKIINDKTILDFPSHDLIIAVDCGSLARTNLKEEILTRERNQKTIEFDHHPKIDNYADLEIREPAYSSTAEVMYYFLKSNKIKINKYIANSILTGLVTDTANFLYPSTSDKTIQIASEMLIHGARLPVIMENTWRNKSIGAMKIWGIALSNLQLNKKYNLAFSVLTKEDLNKHNTTEEEIEGIASFLGNLYGVMGLMFLREEEDGSIKGSLRSSHPEMDVSKLAQILGGGGHAKASGFHVQGKLTRNGNQWRIE